MKLDLLDEFQTPSPFPKDKFIELDLPNDLTYAMFSSTMTGTQALVIDEFPSVIRILQVFSFCKNYLLLDFNMHLLYLGTGMHSDLLYTDSFNGLLKGKKWWVLMPRDIYEFPQDYSCLKHCSEELSLNYHNDVKLWFLHILPQLR